MENEGKNIVFVNSFCLDVVKNKVPILFYANKSDLPNAHPTDKIADSLNLATIENHVWHI